MGQFPERCPDVLFIERKRLFLPGNEAPPGHETGVQQKDHWILVLENIKTAASPQMRGRFRGERRLDTLLLKYDMINSSFSSKNSCTASEVSDAQEFETTAPDAWPVL